MVLTVSRTHIALPSLGELSLTTLVLSWLADFPEHFFELKFATLSLDIDSQ